MASIRNGIGEKNMYVDPFYLGIIVGAFSMLVSIVIFTLIVTRKR